MSVSITLALMELRDIYRKQAEDIIAASEPRLQAAKDEYHSAKIEHNRLQKLANNIELLITADMKTALNEKIRIDRDWSFNRSEV